MPLHFQPFDPHRPVRIYRRNLPHWRQDGATYFVTFRLADALPQHLVQQLERIRTVLLAARDADSDHLKADREYFRCMKQHLDQGLGSCCLRQPAARAILLAAFRHGEGDRYELGEHAVMPNHVHVLVRPLVGHELEDIVHQWKGSTAREINRTLGASGRVWQDESYERLVRDSLELARTSRYIVANGQQQSVTGTGAGTG